MISILTVIHILVCFFLIVIVLLQHGKGADMGATFGGSSQTVFGSEGPVPLLNKITTSGAVIFMVTSLSLAYIGAHAGSGSVMRSVQPPAPTPVEGQLQRSPATIPLPDEAPAGTSEAPAEFPGEKAAAPVTDQAPEATDQATETTANTAAQAAGDAAPPAVEPAATEEAPAAPTE